MTSNDDAMDQGSDGGASPLRDSQLSDFDDEGGAQVGPAVNPNLLRAQAAKGPMPKATAAGAGVGPLLPPPSVTMRQLTEGTEAAAMLNDVSIAASAVAAPAAPEMGTGPALSADAPAAGVKGLGSIGVEEEEEEEESLTPEEKEQAEHIKTVEAVIAAAMAAGFTFSEKSRWLAAEAYVNNKKVFDDAGVDITVCIKPGFKEINRTRVNEKLAELREAEEALVTSYVGGLSQELVGDQPEPEAPEQVVYSDNEYEGLSKQTCDAKKEQFEIDLLVAESKDKADPVRIAFRQYNHMLVALKGTPGYADKEEELKMIRDHYNERYFENAFVVSLSVWQMQFMAAMWKAEVEKRELPSTIKDLKKKLRKVKSALQDIAMEKQQKQEDKKSEKANKRAQAAIAEAIGTPSTRQRR
eukprot:scaffold16543_cov76-Phaeocystis_antarctica.AAC.1